MKYVSTRGGGPYTFKEALFGSLAEDKGMYLPESIPKLSPDELKAFSGLSYPDVVVELLSHFVTEEDLPKATIRSVVAKAFSGFVDPEVVTTTSLGPVTMGELFLGPTLAFKDLALSVVAGLLEAFIARDGGHLLLLVGTSGDTGSAAMEAVKDSDHMDIVVLYPKGRTSVVQELQMATCIASNIHLIAADGTSDDLDVPIKRVFSDPAFTAKHDVASINSINVGRILVQVAHYVYLTCQLAGPEFDHPVSFTIPTGACGNITAGAIARDMGFPISKLVAAVNANDIVHRFVSRGDLTMRTAVIGTSSPSMDIQAPYNVERLLYLATDGDARQVAEWMSRFDSTGDAGLPDTTAVLLQKRLGLRSVPVSEDVVGDTICWAWRKHGYVPCPHSAVALAAAAKLPLSWDYSPKSDGPICALASAHAAKFEESVAGFLGVPKATAHAMVTSGRNFAVTRGLEALPTLPRKEIPYGKASSEWADTWTADLRALIARITTSRKPAGTSSPAPRRIVSRL